jgi:cyclohexanecarboxylate-CoA ligase
MSLADAIRDGELRVPNHTRERFYAAGAWHSETVLDHLREHARRSPQATAIVAHEPGRDLRRISYGDYWSLVVRCAAGLRDLGVGTGEVIALWLPNVWQLPVLTLAGWRTGAVVAPLMPSFGPREVERMLGRVGAVLCVTDHERAEPLAAIAGRVDALRTAVVLERPRRHQISFIDAFPAPTTTPDVRPPGTGADAPAPLDPDRVSTIFFTSGTTGEPKGVLHSLNTLGSAPRAWNDLFEISADDRFFTPHPLAHAGGMGIGVFRTLMAGASVVLMRTFDPGIGAELVASEAVSVLAGAPNFQQQLLDHGLATEPRLRVVYCLGAAVPAGLVTRVRDQLGLALHCVWGMTEATAIVTRPDDPDGYAAESIGRPLPSLQARLVAGGAEEISPEHPGVLWVRGAGVCLAQMSRDDDRLTMVCDADDGWLETGDLAVVDAHGGVRLMGRVAERIGTGPMIPVLDVENELCQHPRVADAAVIGIPDGDGDEAVCAVITTHERTEAPTLADVRSFLAARGMTDWYLPRRLEVVESLPRGSSGKVQKHRLRDALAT